MPEVPRDVVVFCSFRGGSSAVDRKNACLRFTCSFGEAQGKDFEFVPYILVLACSSPCIAFHLGPLVGSLPRVKAVPNLRTCGLSSTFLLTGNNAYENRIFFVMLCSFA